MSNLENSLRLAEVGPPHPDYGFPLWYEDGNGTRLALGIDADPQLPAIELPAGGRPFTFPGNYPAEAFYYLAGAEMPIGGAGGVGRARLVIGLEAAFGGAGEPAEGARVVFARIRVRIDDVIPLASYDIVHPYGRYQGLTADDRGRVFFTDDRGIGEEDFAAVLSKGLVAPFLTWDSGAPPGYLGDGVTPHRVVGSPFGTNIFRIEGSGVAAGGGPVDPADPTNPDVIQTDLFTVQGQLAVRVGVAVTGATYTTDGAGRVFLDVHARSAPGQDIELMSPRAPFAGADRDYSVRAQLPLGSPIPPTVEVINVGDTPRTADLAELTDLVTITLAEFEPSTATLRVAARSTDPGANLVAVGYGPITPGANTTYSGVQAMPATITVTSDRGARVTQRVVLVGTASATLPVVADAGPDASGIAGSTLVLDGTRSRGDITSYAWSQSAGPAVQLVDPETPRPRFVVPAAAASVTIDLSVTDPATTDTDSVVITSMPSPPPDAVTIVRRQFRTGRRQWRISGTLTPTGSFREVVVSFKGHELGRSPVDIAGDWDVRYTPKSTEQHLVPKIADTVVATSAGPAGGSAIAAVDIRN